MTITIPALLPSIQIVAAAVDEAQTDSFGAAYSFNLVETLKKKLNALCFQIAERYPDEEPFTSVIHNTANSANLLVRNISMMFSKHATVNLLELIYILTPEGRYDFRLEFPDVIVTPDPPYAKVGARGFNERADHQNKIVNYLDNLQHWIDEFNPQDELEEDDGEYMPDSAGEEETSDTKLSSDDESIDEDSANDESLNAEAHVERELLEINETGAIDQGDPTALFISVLEEQLILTHSREEVNNAVQCFLNWVMQSTDMLKITPLIGKSPIVIWTYLKSKAEWKVLADFALRCFSLVGSEAGVERLFSQQKYVGTPDKCASIGGDTQ